MIKKLGFGLMAVTMIVLIATPLIMMSFESKAEIPELNNAFDNRFVSPIALKEALSVLESQNNLLINRIKIIEKKLDKVCK